MPEDECKFATGGLLYAKSSDGTWSVLGKIDSDVPFEASRGSDSGNGLPDRYHWVLGNNCGTFSTTLRVQWWAKSKLLRVLGFKGSPPYTIRSLRRNGKSHRVASR